MHIAKVLHLSDLHFVKELTEEGRALHAKARDLLKAKPHSFAKLEALAVRVKFLEEQGGRFDLILGTGDLTTNGSSAALRTALEFLEKDEVRMGSPSRPIVEGLSADKSRRLLLPGNHDRYTRSWVPFQSRSDVFETVLGTSDRYPYVVGYRNPARTNDTDERALLFFVFDSTPSAAVSYAWSGPGSSKFGALKRIARGRLEGRECRWLEDKAKELERTGQVQALDGGTLNIDYGKCVRLAVLHHHPYDGANTTLMENSQLFIRHCFRAGVDLVLFGHDHKEFYWPEYSHDPAAVSSAPSPHWVQFFCCPSATEYAEKKNGFYVFDFHDTHYTVQLHEWKEDLLSFDRKYYKQLPYGRSI
jgi:3',5'-cyclic AMP phosphodiesterase CpdA